MKLSSTHPQTHAASALVQVTGKTEQSIRQILREKGRNQVLHVREFAMKLPTCYEIFVYLAIVYVIAMLGSIPWITPCFTG